MKTMYIGSVLTLASMACFAAAADGGGDKFDAKAWEAWGAEVDGKIKALEKADADAEKAAAKEAAKAEKDGAKVAERIAQMEAKITALEATASAKADKDEKGHAGRLDVIERTLGIGQVGGDPTKDNDGKKIGAGENDPSSPESDKKAGKV